MDLLGPGVALRVEHYGSTSIPVCPAKPIIDILVEIPSWEEGRKRAIPVFNSPEIEYWFYNDHMCFILRDKVTVSAPTIFIWHPQVTEYGEDWRFAII